ncbi:hypothetical protein IGM_04371 [Bacillus cereus HuB4-4]|uniref:Uncharacterized protein n=1 Tax=Bacillus cereus HuB4-4 TaxID=1053211 RepID=A0A9W5QS70_BACCE|nr:hypothetical protein [Bacillus cereus]EOP85996.1 hypothetical protein IGM_04371 [Bacillus cereus HuB4-4]
MSKIKMKTESGYEYIMDNRLEITEEKARKVKRVYEVILSRINNQKVELSRFQWGEFDIRD